MVRQCLRLHVLTFFVLLAGSLAGPVLEAQDPASEPGGSARSPRNANYTVDVRLDPETRALEGRTVLTWRNIKDRPTDELRFHLYWNAWRNNRSSWMAQRRLDFRPRSKREPLEDSWSFIEVDNVRLLPSLSPEETTTEVAGREDATDVGEPVELNGALDYLAPDDGNLDDKTVMRVRLPRTVAPGETIVVELDWRARVPRTFARTGFRGDFFFIAHWFPKLGVYEDGGTWNCHQFWTTTEFFSDYGNYDVSMTVPDNFVVGATGREIERRDNGDGTATHRYVQEDVHGFTWTTSPDYVIHEKRFEKQGLPSVEMRLLLQPEHLEQAERHFTATSAALEHYGAWYGPYPYQQITIIDPAYASGAGGMEYPTLFTAGTSVNNPFGGGGPEGVTIHEAGHQFWYGLVGNNEFEHAWLDEGLNTFSTARAYDVAYGERLWREKYFNPPAVDFDGFFAMLFDDIRLSRDVYGNRLNRSLKSGVEFADPQSTPSFRYFPTTSGRLSYDRTAQWLATLEKHLGWDTLQKILSTFFERYRFGHPSPEDFFAVANEVSGQDLSWFFDQVHYRTIRFDYSVDSVASVPIEWKGWSNDSKPTAAPRSVETASYRHEVVVRRLGEGVFPVEVLLVLEDGSEIRRSWDGRDKWTLIVEESDSKLHHAIVDPERILLLDLRYTNNSMKRKPAPVEPAVRWSSRWMIWLQDLLTHFTFFV